MNERVVAGRWIAVSRIALVGLIGGAASACSSDTMRFADSPFANPFASSQRVAAAEPQSAAPAAMAPMPTAPVQTASLPPVQSQALPPVQAQSARVAAAPVTSGSGGWTAAGGTAVTVGSNDNLNALSQRYGVPASAILAANGLSSAQQLAPGRQVVIPVYNASGQATHVAAPVQPAGQTKFRLVAGPKPAAQKVAGPAEAPQTRARPTTTIAQKPEKAAPVQVASAAPAPVVAVPVAAPKAPEPQKVAARIEPQPVKPVVQAQPAAPAPQAEAAKPVQDPEQTASLPNSEFRWPARGRVIAGFGANGGNEGINIALPEGTPVKAAEAGTVTYAGDEVKGYGNLILIRHDNGFVSAYAHNGELNVKRGERVKRGQAIAKSGQSGNVTSPQLHFEIRKGQSPVDPLAYLGN